MTYAVPRMIGISLSPATLTWPSKTLPMMLSCRQTSPSRSLPSAKRHGELCACSGTARRTVVFQAGTEHKIAAVGVRRVGKQLDVIDLGAVVASNIISVQRISYGNRKICQLLKVRELDTERMIAYEKKPISSPCDVASDSSKTFDIDLDIFCDAITVDVGNCYRTVGIQRGLDVSDGRLDLVCSGSDSAKILERFYEPDRAVPAHSEIADVVEIDNACGGIMFNRIAE